LAQRVGRRRELLACEKVATGDRGASGIALQPYLFLIPAKKEVASMSNLSFDNLVELLDVRLDAFAMCEIEDSCSLACAPMDFIVVHFVLQGTGSIECEHGTFPIRPGMMIVVPKLLAKNINGEGPVLRTIQAEESCPFTDGMVRFRACETRADLILGCASVRATVGEGLALFEHLREPLIEESKEPALPLLFETVLAELSAPGMGTKAMVGSIMKQIMVLLLRAHLKRTGLMSPLWMPLVNPQLGRAVAAILARPQDPHCVEGLAALAGMSRSNFTRRFTESYGRSPMDFVQTARLNHAARLLQTSQLPIKAVAAAVGYASRSHLSRAFRAAFGTDPTAFREHARGGAAPIAVVSDESSQAA
jgi:AraC-like DNA-binding protein